MLVVGCADYENSPQIDDGLDITVTGTILTLAGSAPITSGLGTLSSTVSVNQATAAAGPTPVATSGGQFTIVIPIATLQAGSTLFITVTSSISGSRPWTIFLRPWLQAEPDLIESDKFIVNIDAGRGSSQGSIMDFYTGLWHPAEDIAQVDGVPVAKRMGYARKELESEL